MSYYYKYNFVSPEPIYAIIKEELKSYFDTGAIDDLLFPTYLNKCLGKLGKTTYMIVPEILYVDNFVARLPDNFYAIREAWACSEIPLHSYQSPNSTYFQPSTLNIVEVTPEQSNSCVNPECNNSSCKGECDPNIVQAVYKINDSYPRAFRREYLLKPGNISNVANCGLQYSEAFVPGDHSLDSFDIRDNKFVTTFRTGVVHVLMYVIESDEIGNQMIPDNYRIKEYVEAFIKYKLFELLTNQTNDETFNQLEKKLTYYKQLSDEAFIMADIEVKKQDVYSQQRRIIKDLNRFNMYELPDANYNRYGRRRNN